MIAKRLGALVVAVGLIVGALAIRRGLIESDGDDGASSGGETTTLVCASELRDVCRAADLPDDIDVVFADAGDTLADLASADATAPERADVPVWLTFDPFPEMVATQRELARRDPLDLETVELARSPLAIVVRAADADELTGACGTDVDLRCLGEQTDLDPTFAPLDTGIGTIGVAAAVTAFGSGTVDLGDLSLLTWARPLAGAGTGSLSGGTAIQTIQTRPTFAVAIGAEAELADSQRDRFEVLYPAPMVDVAVVLAAPAGADVPGGLATALTGALTDAGWDPSRASEPTGLPDPGTILAIRSFWEDL